MHRDACLQLHPMDAEALAAPDPHQLVKAAHHEELVSLLAGVRNTEGRLPSRRVTRHAHQRRSQHVQTLGGSRTCLGTSEMVFCSSGNSCFHHASSLPAQCCTR